MDKLKAFTVRFPKPVWVFLKKCSIEQERSMADVIIECITKYKRRVETKELTDDDTLV